MAIAQNYFSGKSKGGRIGTIVLVANIPTGFTNKYILCNGQTLDAFQYRRPVSYTHLTLPTKA